MMTDIKAEAIILDLFGTLVDNFSFQSHEIAVTEMSALLGVSRADFSQGWVEMTGEGRLSGAYPTIEANIEHVCVQLGTKPDPARISAAARVTLDFTRQALIPRAGAIEMLAEAKALDYKLGLISDCSPAVPQLWSDTTFAPLIDVPIFSCAVGLKKPDPRIYRLACRSLGVRAERCVYVGDGSSDELRGASKAGMYTILFSCDYTDSYDAHRPTVDGWQGPMISRFDNLLPLMHSSRF